MGLAALAEYTGSYIIEKKSKRGIATPKQDMGIIRARLKVAAALAKELRNEKTAH